MEKPREPSPPTSTPPSETPLVWKSPEDKRRFLERLREELKVIRSYRPKQPPSSSAVEAPEPPPTEGAARAIEIFDRLYTRPSGPLADLMNEGARRVARGEAPEVVSADLYEAIVRILQDALRSQGPPSP